jgi:hypothetical protein
MHVCGIYIVVNLILLCSLETCLSYFELKNFARAYGLSFYTFFFFLSIFLLTWILVHFSYTLFLVLPHNSLLHLEFEEKTITKNSEHLFLINIFVFSPSIGVKHF